MKPDFKLKVLKRLMDLRYSKQHELRDIKYKYFSRRIEYSEIINQDLRLKDNTELDDLVKNRWDRQIRHPLLNQKKIKNANVIVFGCGGIGSNALIGLVYSGVYNFTIIDFDEVKLSNLNRQTLYTPNDVGSSKVLKAKSRLEELNPNIHIKAFDMKLNYPESMYLLEMDENSYNPDISVLNKLVKESDFIIIAVDYYGAPYMINDLCVKNKKPYYWAGVNHSIGEIYNFNPNYNSPCLRCIFGPNNFIDKTQFLRYKTPENQLEKGVNLGSTVISTGNFLSEMIIQDICGFNNKTHGKLFIYDAFNLEFVKIPIIKDDDCGCIKFNS